MALMLFALLLAGCRPPTATVTPTQAVPTETPPPTQTPTPDPPVTLPVPTQVPYSAPAPTDMPATSRIRSMIDSGTLRVGVKFNEPPFGMLDKDGNVIGYDADIARTLAESWGLALEFVQVTDQTAVPYLLSGEVDLLIAAMPHRRDFEQFMDFSESYYPDGQAAMVRADSDIGSIGQLNQRMLAAVTGSTAAEALAANNLEVTLSLEDTLDEALTALMGSEVDAVVDSLVHLRNAQAGLGGAVKILDDLLMAEPLAIGLPRFDVNLRNAVNRTLQALEGGGRMAEIHGAWFPNANHPGMVTWESVDTRSFTDYPTDIAYVDSVLERIAEGGTLTVAGLSQAGEGQTQMEAFYQQLVEAMAARWGVQVAFVPNTADNPAANVAAGNAQLAVGVEPRWDGADAVSYSQAFLLHGDRLMVRADSEVRGFGDMRGDRVAVFGDNADEMETRANDLALSAQCASPACARLPTRRPRSRRSTATTLTPSSATAWRLARSCRPAPTRCASPSASTRSAASRSRSRATTRTSARW
ncbi:MAG: transporter substrate-binding domain-containing protein [Anaerolineae bacterium]|nr:transporter substrate-binding domain-containing protein [Anaerolineae bacterium]